MVLSETEVVEGGPVSFVNSQQTLFSQFHDNGLYFKDLTNVIGFPAPIQHKEPHKLRDLPNEPMLSVMTDIRYEATQTAAQNRCHRCTVPVSKVLMQRSHTFTEAYYVSDLQKVCRQTQTWPLKARIEFKVNSRNPRLSQNLSMEQPEGQG